VKLLVLSAADLQSVLSMAEAIDAMKEAFAELSAGNVVAPTRLHLPVAAVGGVSLFMAAHSPRLGLAAKAVSVFPGNPQIGKPVVHGLVLVLDPRTGEPCALCDGSFLTAWRTGAASGAATDLLARADASSAAVIGCGAQARTQTLAIVCVRELKEIHLYDTDSERIDAFVADLQSRIDARLIRSADSDAAVAGADIICTATTSRTPVFDGRRLKPGAHVNGVGSFTLDAREIDATTVTRARVFVDSREAALAEAGDLVTPLRAGMTRAEEWTELGDLVRGTAAGRGSDEEITFFKSVGHAVQDVAASTRAVATARACGLGYEIEL
jgi:ornithine cyclodeaminase